MYLIYFSHEHTERLDGLCQTCRRWIPRAPFVKPSLWGSRFCSKECLHALAYQSPEEMKYWAYCAAVKDLKRVRVAVCRFSRKQRPGKFGWRDDEYEEYRAMHVQLSCLGRFLEPIDPHLARTATRVLGYLCLMWEYTTANVPPTALLAPAQARFIGGVKTKQCT